MVALAQSVATVKHLKSKMKHQIMKGKINLDGHLTMLAMQVGSERSISNPDDFNLHEYCANSSLTSLCGKIASLAQVGQMTQLNAMNDVYISKLIV